MTPDLIISWLAGYVSVPVASLLSRRHWPRQARFLVAVVLAVISAAIAALATGQPLDGAVDLFLQAFAVQQVTFHLNVPGAGTSAVNERLLDVGDGAVAD